MADSSYQGSSAHDPFDRNFFAVVLSDLLAKKGATLHQLTRATISLQTIKLLEAGLTRGLQECSLNPLQLRLISSKFGFADDERITLYATSIATAAQRYLLRLELPPARAWAITSEICDTITPRLAQQRDFMIMLRVLEEGYISPDSQDSLLRPIAALYEDGALSRISAQFLSEPIVRQEMLENALLSLARAATRFKDLPSDVQQSDDGVFWRGLIREAIGELRSDGVQLPDPNEDI